MKRKKINALFVLLAAAISLLVLWAVQRLLVPKYMGMVVEGNLTGEYYKEVPDHDVLILGNCEAYENISPAVLWREFGISSYIRGNANQLMAQSYYLLEDALKYEVPGVVVLSVSSMTNFSQDNESYTSMSSNIYSRFYASIPDGRSWKKRTLLISGTEGPYPIMDII